MVIFNSELLNYQRVAGWFSWKIFMENPYGKSIYNMDENWGEKNGNIPIIFWGKITSFYC